MGWMEWGVSVVTARPITAPDLDQIGPESGLALPPFPLRLFGSLLPTGLAIPDYAAASWWTVFLRRDTSQPDRWKESLLFFLCAISLYLSPLVPLHLLEFGSPGVTWTFPIFHIPSQLDSSNRLYVSPLQSPSLLT